MKTDSRLDHQLQNEPAKWIRNFARFGYAAKGVVYLLVGILAVQAAFNWGGQVTGSRGAFQAIASQPFGNVLLFLVSVGLVGYAVWRFIEAIRDPEHSDSGFKAFGRRASYAVSGFIYGGLAFLGFRIALGSTSGSGGSSSTQSRTSELLAQPFGRWLVGLIGVVIIAYGFYCFYKAVKAQFRRYLKLYEMSPEEEKWATRIGRFGIFSRGIVSVIIGYFFIQAARASDSDQVRNTAGALRSLQQQPFGAWLMGIVALGLIAYGLHMLVQARYRRISP